MSGRGGLYIHIPFCRQKCRYCDFASFAGADDLIDAYLAALHQEASLYKGQQFETLYIGGGTPSLLSAAQLQQLLQIVTCHFGPVSSFTESTLEANPESISTEKLRVLKDSGLNRLSIGVQSMEDDTLRRIGRVHDKKTFLTAFAAARQVGFDNISLDLIAGLPGQTETKFLDGLKQVVALAPEHISVYGLQVEENTPFYKEGIQTDEDLLRRELEQTHYLLQQAGYTHYEISNFARPGLESRHNSNYWQNGEYLGLGSAAASYQNGVRRSNVTSLREYLHRVQNKESVTDFSEHLTGKAAEGEKIMLGLRQLGGVHLSALQQNLFSKEIAAICARGLVERKGDLLKLTLEGMFLANQAFMAFVGPFEK